MKRGKYSTSKNSNRNMGGLLINKFLAMGNLDKKKIFYKIFNSEEENYLKSGTCAT
jgi:hypothetical protein